MKRINKIFTRKLIDSAPDTSWMGHYSNKPSNDYAIDRGLRGDMSLNEYRYFNPPIKNYSGEKPEDIRRYTEQDYERMEGLNKGNWCFIGIVAEAQIVTSQDGKYWNFNKVQSSGLWGIESDSDASYFKEVADEEISQLETILKKSWLYSRRNCRSQ